MPNTLAITGPVYGDYFADPFVLRVGDQYFAYGTGVASPGPVFETLSSADLKTWTPRGRCLVRLDAGAGDEYWAPEVAVFDNAYWMYYSVGHGISGHHLRVARAENPIGPFIDQGVNLTPREMFAIDPHPFQDRDGSWYLYYARDVLDGDRPGTHLAVDRLVSVTQLAGDPVEVLAPYADWQLFAADRRMYGSVYQWHTLEGPTVVYRSGRYWMTFSGGSWEGDGYGVAWATAEHPLGPWAYAPEGTGRLLETTGELIGPGHSSLTTTREGGDVIVFHAWDTGMANRLMHVRPIFFGPDGPRIG
ncbi:MAG: glycoside hydrolase [Homoserinimonas sp.]|jgi:GH43 family beta-xylosidase|nr:glycoside hydrolase [Homoserinimonas sp.]